MIGIELQASVIEPSWSPTLMTDTVMPMLDGARMRAAAAMMFCLGLAHAPVGAADSLTEALTEALSESRPLVDVRLRSEHVDQGGIAEPADAVTLRARLGFETGAFLDTRLIAESDLLWPLRSDYNSTTNGHSEFPTVNDPESYGINRLQLANTSIPGTTIIAGRQRIALDDERFVSRVSWRQNEQTFDGLHVVNTSVKQLTIDVSYFDQVNRAPGKESPLGRYRGDSYLTNVAYHTPVGTLVGFGYVVNFDEAPRDSTRTVGLRWTGERSVGGVKLAYFASYAQEQAYGDNPLSFDLDAMAVELIGSAKGWSLGGGFENLQGDGTKGFVTPLATAHKFLGWADRFSAAPPNGLKRAYGTLAYTRKNVAGLDSIGATVVYHHFESSRLGMDYGHEVDMQLLGKWHRWAGLVEYANYDADSFATNTHKLWVQAEYVL